MSGYREELLEQALKRVIDLADVTKPSVSTTEIHDAIGHAVIIDLAFPQRVMLGPGQATLPFGRE